MIEKLRAFAESAKAVLLYVLAPLAFVLGYIYYLTAKNSQLKDEIKAGKRSERTKEIENETKEVDRDALDALSEYERRRGEYVAAYNAQLLEVDRQLRQSTGGAEGTDSDQGSED